MSSKTHAPPLATVYTTRGFCFFVCNGGKKEKKPHTQEARMIFGKVGFSPKFIKINIKVNKLEIKVHVSNVVTLVGLR